MILKKYDICGIIDNPNSTLLNTMPRHTLEPVTLVHSHAVKGRKDYREDYQYGVYSGKAFDRKVKNGKVLDKSIHCYRMWFNFLKLALELELQNTVLVTRNSVKQARMGGHIETGRVTQKIKVNISFKVI